MAHGVNVGFAIAPERAITWVTANPAKSLGILERTGTLEPGKMADVVLWNANPFSVYALADQVYIDGALRYDRAHPPAAPDSDFSLGQAATAGEHGHEVPIADRGCGCPGGAGAVSAGVDTGIGGERTHPRRYHPHHRLRMA
jgi:hypothetical protein